MHLLVKFCSLAMYFYVANILPDERSKRARSEEKPIDFSYHKWAHLGVSMLISARDDTKLVLNTAFNKSSMLLVQSPHWIDVYLLQLRNVRTPGCFAKTEILAHVKSKASRKIICSTIANSRVAFAYSDHVKPSVFELKRSKVRKITSSVCRRKLPQRLLFARPMVFTHDSSWLIVARPDRRIYVVNAGSSQLVHAFTPCRKLQDEELLPIEPTITRLFTSSDRQWLAAVNNFGDDMYLT